MEKYNSRNFYNSRKASELSFFSREREFEDTINPSVIPIVLKSISRRLSLREAVVISLQPAKPNKMVSSEMVIGVITRCSLRTEPSWIMERLEAGVVTREFQTVISVFSLRRIEDEERGYRKGREEVSSPCRVTRVQRVTNVSDSKLVRSLVPSRWCSLFHANRSLVETLEIPVWDRVHCLENRATIYYYSSSRSTVTSLDIFFFLLLAIRGTSSLFIAAIILRNDSSWNVFSLYLENMKNWYFSSFRWSKIWHNARCKSSFENSSCSSDIII